jgi:hypothetical protein
MITISYKQPKVLKQLRQLVRTIKVCLNKVKAKAEYLFVNKLMALRPGSDYSTPPEEHHAFYPI